jgi:hypothetical protein
LNDAISYYSLLSTATPGLGYIYVAVGLLGVASAAGRTFKGVSTGVDRADLVVRDPGEEDFTSALHDSTGDVHIPKLPPSNSAMLT